MKISNICDIPEIDFMNELLPCYGLNGFAENIGFCESNLVEMQTVKNWDDVFTWDSTILLTMQSKNVYERVVRRTRNYNSLSIYKAIYI